MEYEITNIVATPLEGYEPEEGRCAFLCSCIVNKELYLRGIVVELDGILSFHYPSHKIEGRRAAYFRPQGKLKKIIEQTLAQAAGVDCFLQ